MTRRFALACLALVASCATEPAVCPDEPVRVLSLAEPMASAYAESAGGHTYYTLQDPGRLSLVVAVGATCQDDAIEVARGINLAPARLHLDPRDDDPTIACDYLGRLFRVDLTGERGPTLLLPRYRCQAAIPSEHGALLTSYRNDEATLWLFPDFPDEASARPIGDANSAVLAGDAVLHAAKPDQIRRHDLVTGDDERVIADAEPTFYATATHLLWRDNPGGDVHAVRLLELATGDQIQLRERDTSGVDSWSFDASGQYVIHTSPWQAFDLEGRALPLPVPGELSRVLPGPAYLSYDEHDGATYYTRLGAHGPVRLDLAYPTEEDQVAIGMHPLFPDRIQYRRPGVIHFIPIDGGPATRIDDVGLSPQWIDAEHLIMHLDEDLVVLHRPSGARTVVIAGITRYSYTDDIPTDGIHVLFVRDGESEVWHYPASVLLAGP